MRRVILAAKKQKLVAKKLVKKASTTYNIKSFC